MAEDDSSAVASAAATAAATVVIDCCARRFSARRASMRDQTLDTNELSASELPLCMLDEGERGQEMRASVGLPKAGVLAEPSPALLGEVPPAPAPTAAPTAAPAVAPASTSGVVAAVGGVSHAPVGMVHARLCEFNLSGALPLLEGKEDIPSAGYHAVCAAAANEPRALRDLRSLCRGLTGDELLPGVRIATKDVDDLSEKCAMGRCCDGSCC